MLPFEQKDPLIRLRVHQLRDLVAKHLLDDFTETISDLLSTDIEIAAACGSACLQGNDFNIELNVERSRAGDGAPMDRTSQGKSKTV